MDNELLDGKDNQEKIHFDYGGGSTASKWFGYVLGVLGVWATYNTFTESDFTVLAKVLSICFVLMGGFLAFTTRGMIINVTTKDSKTYTKVYGIPVGKWVPIEGFPYITVLAKSYKNTISSRTNVTVNFDSEMFYEINLLNKTHRAKHFIKSYESLEEATKQMKSLAPKLGVEVVKYAPKVSQKTKDRRR
jgi:hypothetical protein